MPSWSNLNIRLTIPFKIKLKRADRLVVIGGNGSRESQFHQLFLGNLRVIHGEFRFGGKIGYVPKMPFLKHDSIKRNILFWEQ